MNNDIACAHAYLSGQVQGVGMRAYVRSLARKFEVLGFVRNLGDGRVEVMAEGKRETVATLFKTVKQGFYGHDVEHIDLSWEEPSRKFSSFDITY